MQRTLPFITTGIFLCLSFIGCKKNNIETPPTCTEDHIETTIKERNFSMGFTTWIYAPTVEAKNNTYDFIKTHAEIYVEQIDEYIPWQAWINNTPLPTAFTDDIAWRKSLTPSGVTKVLSVSLLNDKRTDIQNDIDGSLPMYTALNDSILENAYYKHISYLINEFTPSYVVLAMEVNELLMKSPEKWEGYTLLMTNIRQRLATNYPNIKYSESVTLHQWYNPKISNPNTYIQTIQTYVNQLDFAAISYHPFLINQHTPTDFQQAFDFLTAHVTIPIALVETSHIAEDLVLSATNIVIPSNECEQKDYLNTLFTNANEHDFLFVIWWCARDFDALWETFPEKDKELGKLWRDTGILNENGEERPAFVLWEKVRAL